MDFKRRDWALLTGGVTLFLVCAITLVFQLSVLYLLLFAVIGGAIWVAGMRITHPQFRTESGKLDLSHPMAKLRAPTLDAPSVRTEDGSVKSRKEFESEKQAWEQARAALQAEIAGEAEQRKAAKAEARAKKAAEAAEEAEAQAEQAEEAAEAATEERSAGAPSKPVPLSAVELPPDERLVTGTTPAVEPEAEPVPEAPPAPEAVAPPAPPTDAAPLVTLEDVTGTPATVAPEAPSEPAPEEPAPGRVTSEQQRLAREMAERLKAEAAAPTAPEPTAPEPTAPGPTAVEAPPDARRELEESLFDAEQASDDGILAASQLAAIDDGTEAPDGDAPEPEEKVQLLDKVRLRLSDYE